jgi:hypothetical protein
MLRPFFAPSVLFLAKFPNLFRPDRMAPNEVLDYF